MSKPKSDRCRVCGVHRDETPFAPKAGGARCMTCYRAARKVQSRAYRERVRGQVQRTCFRCRETKNGSEFPGAGRYCSACDKKYQMEYRNSTPRRHLMKVLHRMRSNGKDRGATCTVTLDQLQELWEHQKGVCFYTGTPLTFKGDRAHSALSVDRINPALGYEPGNVVLCCWAFNRMKTDLTLTELAELCRAFLKRIEEQPAALHGK